MTAQETARAIIAHRIHRHEQTLANGRRSALGLRNTRTRLAEAQEALVWIDSMAPAPSEDDGLTATFVGRWLTDNYLRAEWPGTPALVECITSQDLTDLDATVEHYRGMESGDPEDNNDGLGFVLSSLVECHTGPHTADCPDQGSE